jgi:hypothetical protein
MATKTEPPSPPAIQSPEPQGSPPVEASPAGANAPPARPAQAHEYDTPGIAPLAFMLAVARDPTVPLPIRLKAAQYAAPFTEHPIAPITPMVRTFDDLDPMDQVIIRIGGLGQITSVSVGSGPDHGSTKSIRSHQTHHSSRRR